MADKFIISAGDLTLRNISTTQWVMRSTTLMNTGIEESVQQQIIRGGKNAPTRYKYGYQKEFTLSAEDCKWNPTAIALNNGTTVQNGTRTVTKVESNVTLGSSGEYTLAETPNSSTVAIEYGDSMVNVAPVGDVVTYASWANNTVNVIYTYAKATVDYITIGASSFPGAYDCTIDADLFDDDHGQIKVGSVQINIPRLQLDGNASYTIDMNNPFTTSFSGSALADDSGNYAYITIILDSSDIYSEISDLWLSPDSDTLDISDGDTLTLTAHGYRGSSKDDIINPTGVTYSSDDEAVATVGASTGVITLVGAGSCTITGSLTVGSNTYTGVCNLTVTA